MAVTKHKLTKNADTINGGTGADLFLAPLVGTDPNAKTTLGTDDKLNGGGGTDTIRATLGAAVIEPVMNSIERGIFSFQDSAVIALDLAHAPDMKSLTLKSPGSLSGASVEIDNADAVTSLSILNGSADAYELDGLDTAKTRTFRLKFNGVTGADIALVSASGKAFANLDIALVDGANVTLTGDAVAAKTLHISSAGTNENELELTPGAHLGEIRNLTVSGSQNLTLYTPSDAFLHLHDFNSTAMIAIVWAKIGGDDLQSVRGGNGTEVIDITAIGGDANARAKVSLGGGHDNLTLDFAFDASTQHYDGGKGSDGIHIYGAAANLNTAVVNFETIGLDNATGVYDVKGMKLVNFLLYSTSSVVTVDHLINDATLGIYSDTTTFLTVNVANATTSTADTMRLLLQNSATLGSSVAGFMAPSLTHLQIDCYSGDHVMYLGSLGSATDAASIEISGGTRLDLNASNNSTSYIQSLVITNDAGADIYGLINGTKAFVTTGATITGGAGDDVLVGGTGADTINSGGGNNTIHGSGGIDTINLVLNSGTDVLMFDSFTQSQPSGFEDVVNNFGSFDTIDVSDMVSNLTFNGNVASKSAGISGLSTGHASAFFVTADHMLYIDVNHDGAIDNGHDFALYLNGVSTLSNANLVD